MKDHRKAALIQVATLAVCLVILLIAMVFALREQPCEEQPEQEEPTALPTGGAEVPITSPPADPATFRFPLADEDFLFLTSPYGHRVSPLLDIEVHHEGLDIGGIWRAQVVAVGDGTVVEHWPPPDSYWRGHEVYGGMVRIAHDNGLETVYAHLSMTTVHQEDRVTAGQVIGRIGNTGRSAGEHLHLEVRDGTGSTLNPVLYLDLPEAGH